MGTMTPDALQKRTKEFALRIMRLTDSLPRRGSARIIADQLCRAGTSVGANYRAACRARSQAEFVSKMGIVEEEVDETGYWMELIVEGGLMKPALVKNLMQEARELLLITIASINTARGGSRTPDKGKGRKK